MAAAVSSMSLPRPHNGFIPSFFTPTSGAVTPLSNEDDEDGRQRKRRRTTPPEKEFETVHGEVCHPPDGNGTEQQPPRHDGASANQAITDAHPAQVDVIQKRINQEGPQEDSRKMIQVRADGKLISPRAHKRRAKEKPGEQEASIPTQETQPSTLCSTEGQTNPKKLMKVRPDGTLASPKNQQNTEGFRKKGRGRPRKPIEGVTRGLVVIRYGTISTSRAAISQRIQEILAGPPGYLGSKITTEPTSRLPEPPKATHPFFLTKPLLTQTSQSHPQGTQTADSQVTKAGNQYSTLPKLKQSPRKAVVSGAGNAWADLGTSERSFTAYGGSGSRFAGAHHPLWPPMGMVHVRPLHGMHSNMPSRPQKRPTAAAVPARKTKLKQSKAIIIEAEEVLQGCRSLVRRFKANDCAVERDGIRSEQLRLPNRRVMVGSELQRLASKAPSSKTYKLTVSEGDSMDAVSQEPLPDTHTHPALVHLFDRIPTSRTAFDRFECETQDWTHKYAPATAEEVLQGGNEARILRDWLQSLTVNSVGRGEEKMVNESQSSKTIASLRKKKRRRTDELDGFVVTSDEEANEMNEIDDNTLVDPVEPTDPSVKKTVLKSNDVTRIGEASSGSEKATNAVVLSGPPGCGKTAAVYAVAKDLGFEVFEINAGSRRSGKDIFDKVGDMSRNHLVNQDLAGNIDQNTVCDDDATRADDAIKKDIESGRQGTMNAFLQTKKDRQSPTVKNKYRMKDHVVESKTQLKAQKQSVILLEEVDVLFEDDKQFWASTMELIVQSRRPVIMTCTDESLLPLDHLPLFGILRFRQPSVQLAIEYLALMAANEGHLLSRDAISALYIARGIDLRATITELHFVCQMAVGDTKGGLEWMLSQPATGHRNESVPDRVVSDGTYLKGMGWTGQHSDNNDPARQVENEVYDVFKVCKDWDIDLADTEYFLPANAFSHSNHAGRDGTLRHLERLELIYDALSAVDTLQCPSFRGELAVPLDVSAPEISEKDRGNYTEGQTLLQDDPLIDHSGISDSIAATTRVLARRIIRDIAQPDFIQPLNERYIAEILPPIIQAQNRPKLVTSRTFSAAFHPIAKPSRGSLASKPPSSSIFDSSISTLVTDVAPYVRSIVSYDLRLEEQRRQLELASQTGRDGKRARTTRASRAALEGGSKANTRRERWFPGNTDFGAVLRTGVREWQDVALRLGEREEAGGTVEGREERSEM